MEEKKEYPLVLVEWEDSHGDVGWEQLEDEIEDRALVCRSVGWLVLDGEHAKVVVPHRNEQEEGVPLQGSGVMTIPTRAVLRVVELGEPDPKAQKHREDAREIYHMTASLLDNAERLITKVRVMLGE